MLERVHQTSQPNRRPRNQCQSPTDIHCQLIIFSTRCWSKWLFLSSTPRLANSEHFRLAAPCRHLVCWFCVTHPGRAAYWQGTWVLEGPWSSFDSKPSMPCLPFLHGITLIQSFKLGFNFTTPAESRVNWAIAHSTRLHHNRNHTSLRHSNSPQPLVRLFCSIKNANGFSKFPRSGRPVVITVLHWNTIWQLHSAQLRQTTNSNPDTIPYIQLCASE